MQKLESLTSEDKEVLKTSLEQLAPNTVVTIRDLRQIEKICKVLEQTEETLEFEDADYYYLKERFESFTGWNPSAEARKVIIAVGEKFTKEH